MQAKCKKSIFNIIVDKLTDGRFLVFNTFHSTFGIMDEYTKAMYDDIENITPSFLKAESDSKSFSVLAKMGFIVPEELDELSLVELEMQKGKFDNSKVSLTVAPILSCNMSCPYCFEQFESGKMNDVIQESLCIFLEELISNSNCKHLHITWYGGEPLLAVDVIESLSIRFIKICETNKVTYTASIITNGVLLSHDIAEKLVEYRVLKAQITIDGMPDYHNKRRILKSGEDSFNTIMDNIEKCKELIEINVRVNVDDGNIENMDDFLNYIFLVKGWKKNPSVYLSPVENYTDNEYFQGTNAVDMSRFFHFDALVLGKTCDIENDRPNERLYPRRRGSYCQAVTLNTYVVDPDGYLYKCWNVIGNKEKAIGTLSNHKQLNLEGLKWLTHKPGEICMSCPYLPICLGGCPYQYIIKGEQSCGFFKKETTERLKLAYQQYMEVKRES